MAKYKKRADGRYSTTVQLHFDPETGKPVKKIIYARTITELESIKVKLINQRDKGFFVNDKNLSVGEWAASWINTYKTGKSHNTWKMYDNVIRNHITPELGPIPLSKLTTHHIQSLINDRYNKGYTRIIEQIYLTINAILEKARNSKLIFENVASEVELPTIERSEKQPLTDLDKKALSIAELTSKQKAFVAILRFCGLRRGEILALMKSDIDLNNRIIKVNKAIYFKQHKPEFKEPKAAGYRKIDIPEIALKPIQDYMDQVTIYMFPMKNGSPMTDSSFRAFWESLYNKLNKSVGGNSNIKLLNLTPHRFRHEYATSLYYAGVDLKQAQYLLGHRDVNTTLKIYTHLDKEEKSSIIKLDAYLNKNAQVVNK